MDNVKQLLRGMQSHTVVRLMTQCYFQTCPSTAWPWSCKEVQICPWVLHRVMKYLLSCLLFAVLSFPGETGLLVSQMGRELRPGEEECRVLLIPGSRRSPGGGNGNSLRYSCLENPMDRGAWWATVQGVTESDMTEWPSMHIPFHNPFWQQRRLVKEWRIPV